MGLCNLSPQLLTSFNKDTAELTAVSSETLQQAYDFSRKHAILKAYGSHEELAFDPQIDAVYISVPVDVLKDTIHLVLRAQKNVVSRNLPRLNQQELFEVMRMADKRKRVIADSIDSFYQAVSKDQRKSVYFSSQDMTRYTDYESDSSVR